MVVVSLIARLAQTAACIPCANILRAQAYEIPTPRSVPVGLSTAGEAGARFPRICQAVDKPNTLHRRARVFSVLDTVG